MGETIDVMVRDVDQYQAWQVRREAAIDKLLEMHGMFEPPPSAPHTPKAVVSVQKIEIVASSNQSPSSVAQEVEDRLGRLRE